MIRRLAQSRLLRLFGTSVGDQAMLSAANFVVGILLLRYTPAEQYGTFILTQSAIFLAVAAQGAWIAGPLSILAPKQTEQERSRMIGAVERDQRRYLWALAGLGVMLPPAGYLAGLWDEQVAAIGTVGVIAAWATLRRELMRTVLLIHAQPQQVFAVDALFVGVLLGSIAAVVSLPGPAAMWAVAALAAGSFVGAWHGRRVVATRYGWTTAAAAPYWRQMRSLGIWSVVGAVIYWVHSQSYNYLLAARLDLQAVAHVNAVRLLLMPAFLLMVGVSSLLIPMAAGWLRDDGPAALLRRLWLFGLGMLVLNVCYIAVLWPLRGWITDELMRTEIPDRDLLLLLWAAHACISSVGAVLRCALIVQEKLQALAALTAMCAATALITMWLAIPHFGAAGAMIGTAAGEALGLLGVLILIGWYGRKTGGIRT